MPFQRILARQDRRAATNDTLAEIQHRTLTEIRRELEAQLTAANIPAPSTRAALLLATVDGLALDAVSAPGMYTHDDLSAALSLHLRCLLQ